MKNLGTLNKRGNNFRTTNINPNNIFFINKRHSITTSFNTDLLKLIMSSGLTLVVKLEI